MSRFLTRIAVCLPHYPLAFRFTGRNARHRASFLDFAINDGERPELTNIMDEYFRGRDVMNRHAGRWCGIL
ncbi:hypothetical protein KCP73_04130 [Salmonella enterica subsp. enterica]|nr:hypothetical protein KCP73_04130 [Salmonella enterica subsp. enterica]